MKASNSTSPRSAFIRAVAKSRSSLFKNLQLALVFSSSGNLQTKVMEKRATAHVMTPSMMKILVGWVSIRVLI